MENKSNEKMITICVIGGLIIILLLMIFMCNKNNKNTSLVYRPRKPLYPSCPIVNPSCPIVNPSYPIVNPTVDCSSCPQTGGATENTCKSYVDAAVQKALQSIRPASQETCTPFFPTCDGVNQTSCQSYINDALKNAVTQSSCQSYINDAVSKIIPASQSSCVSYCKNDCATPVYDTTTCSGVISEYSKKHREADKDSCKQYCDGNTPAPIPAPIPAPTPAPAPAPAPGPPGPKPIVQGKFYPPEVTLGNNPTSMMGNNDWIFMIKLGIDAGEPKINCSGDNSCKFLYASSTSPTLQLIDGINVDSEDDRNPVYQLYKMANTNGNKYVSWNDQGSEPEPNDIVDKKATKGGKSCGGPSGAAHDKGIFVYNNDMTDGVYLQHSNPNWGIFEKPFNYKIKTKDEELTQGLKTNFAQHMVFVSVKGAAKFEAMFNLMNNASLCKMPYGDMNNTQFKPCYSSCDGAKTTNNPKTKESDVKIMTETISNNVQIISKNAAYKGYDAWGKINTLTCNKGSDNSKMYMLGFCVPNCPLGNNASQDPINNIIDVTNTTGHNSSTTPYYSLNPDTVGCKIGNIEEGGTNQIGTYHQNHCKIGVCEKPESGNYVIIGGNNHATPSQGIRGGMFVVIDNKELADGLRCLFKPIDDKYLK